MLNTKAVVISVTQLAATEREVGSFQTALARALAFDLSEDNKRVSMMLRVLVASVSVAAAMNASNTPTCSVNGDGPTVAPRNDSPRGSQK